MFHFSPMIDPCWATGIDAWVDDKWQPHAGSQTVLPETVGLMATPAALFQPGVSLHYQIAQRRRLMED